MSYYHDRYAQHPVHAALAELRRMAEDDSLKSDDAEATAGLARVRHILKFTSEFMARVDPDLTTPQMLDSLQSAISATSSRYDNFRSDGNWQELNNHADAILNHLSSVLSIPSGFEAKNFSLSLEEFRTEVMRSLDTIKAYESNERLKVDESVRQLGEQAQSIKEKLTNFDAQFEQQKARVDTLITEQQETFTKRQIERVEEHKAALSGLDSKTISYLKDSSDKLDSAIRKCEDSRTSVFARIDEQSGAALKELGSLRDRAKNIVGIIGNIGVTGDFQKVANREWWAAEILRTLSISLLLGMIGIVIWVVFNIGDQDFNWEIGLFRIAVALTFVGPAVYCARESTKHRKIENRNRRIELELATISPYLEQLSPEKGQQIREQLASQYFGVHEEKEESAFAGMKHIRGDKVAKAFLDLVKALK